jgi:hypothetical protein
LGGFGEKPIADGKSLGQEREVKPEDLTTARIRCWLWADRPIRRKHHVDLASDFSEGGRSRP